MLNNITNLPDKVDYILRTIENDGGEAYIVGGCVRDLLWGKTPKDYDITTNLYWRQVEILFYNQPDIPYKLSVVETGTDYGTITIVLDGEPFEITTYRTDSVESDGRRPKEVMFGKSIEEDLARRDFTINAMAWNYKKGLVDLYGGQEDLINKVLRTVGNARTRFNEDGLRLMRAFRFAVRYGLKVHEDILDRVLPYCECKRLLANISKERIRDELLKLLDTQHARFDYNILSQFSTLLATVFRVVEPYNKAFREVVKKLEFIGCIKYKSPITKYVRLFSILSNIQDVGLIFNEDWATIYKLPKRYIKVFKKLLAYEKLCGKKIHLNIKYLPRYRHLFNDTEFIVSMYKSHTFYDDADISKALRKPCSVSDLKIDGNFLLKKGYSGRRIGFILNSVLNEMLWGKLKNNKLAILRYIRKFKKLKDKKIKC